LRKRRGWHGFRKVVSGPNLLGSKMTRTLTAAVCAALLICVGAASPALISSAHATSRIKDLANIEGVRQNQLIGYGLVVGLNGTGDTLNNIPFTRQSLQAMLERLGVNIRGQQIRTGNVAAVMVTANLPAFGTQGTRIDVTVSALGDAKSLQGGTLLVTPLLGADGNVYAVAQGSLAISGFQAEGEAAKIVRGVPTVGRISNGAIIEREIEFALNRLGQVRLALRNADFTTARRIASAINDFIGTPTAEPLDPSTVQLTIPEKFQGNVVALLTEIEQLQVEPDLAAKVVIDERSGIIVMGRDVRVSTVAVAQGNLTVTISEAPQVSQPQPFSRGQTRVVPRTRIGVQEDGRRLAVVREGVSLQQLVDGLNALGIGPRDLISILQAIKAAGAIQADIEVM
jgi:flagellar P-ring protein precursor FlgI